MESKRKLVKVLNRKVGNAEKQFLLIDNGTFCSIVIATPDKNEYVCSSSSDDAKMIKLSRGDTEGKKYDIDSIDEFQQLKDELLELFEEVGNDL